MRHCEVVHVWLYTKDGRTPNIARLSYGDLKDSDRYRTVPHGHRTGSLRFPLKVCGDNFPTVSVRF